jgi:hypothetical protein
MLTTEQLLTIWNNEKPIKTPLPIVFPNGNKLTTFGTYCQKCSTAISPPFLRGRITWADNDMFTFKAIGYCQSCNIYHPFLYSRMASTKNNQFITFYSHDEGQKEYLSIIEKENYFIIVAIIITMDLL